jgi:hypothetical protein
MDWSKLFKSRYTLLLEQRIDELRADGDKREKHHSEELDRAISELKELREENLRLRLYLVPAAARPLQPEEKEEPADPNAMPKFQGTPFERVIQREMWVRQREEARRRTIPVPPAGAQTESGEVQ